MEHCDNCGGAILMVRSGYEWRSRFLGPLSLDNIEYFRCRDCAEVQLTPAAVQAMDQREREVLDEYLQNQPLKAFMSEPKACEALGVTRAALHKNRQVERGMIYNTRFEGHRFFLRRSVERFIQSKDGRLPIFAQGSIVDVPCTPPPSESPIESSTTSEPVSIAYASRVAAVRVFSPRKQSPRRSKWRLGGSTGGESGAVSRELTTS